MEIRRLDHAALLVKDVERSRRFYGQVLGMEEVPRPSNSPSLVPGFVKDMPRSS